MNDDLTGKTVECGACDHRFLVEEESIFAERSKVYPGENNKRDDGFLSRLGRSHSTSEEGQEGGSPKGGGNPKVDAIMPAGAGQNIAVGAGIIFLFLYVLIFFLGTSDGGSFQDVGKAKRYILGAFVLLISGGLILLGAKNWRGRAFFLTLLLGAALFALILTRPIYTMPDVGLISDPELGSTQSAAFNPVDQDGDLRDLKARVGYQVIENSLASKSPLTLKFGNSASQHIVAIFIEDLASSQFHNLEKYFQIELKIPPTEAISRYSRNNEKDSLIVISGFQLDFDSVVQVCDPRLGRATTYPELRLIELELSALHESKIKDDLRDKLSNPAHPSFFIENLNALRALDPLRRKEAVKELAKIPPNVELRYGEEIIAEFIRLIRSDADSQLLSDMGRALSIWATDDSVVVDIVTEKVEEMMKSESDVPTSLIDFLVRANGEKAPLLIETLWVKNPEVWRSQCIALGVSTEERMLFYLEGPSIRLRKAATLVLGSTGTKKALQALSKYQNTSDSELRVLVERAIAAIKGR